MIILWVCVLLLPVCFSHPLAGWVNSPGYPGGYEPDFEMMWERCAPSGHTLTLSFIHFDLEDSYECENDAVKVFADSALLTTLCGRMTAEKLKTSINPSLHSTPGGCLSLTFQSDYSNTERQTGFRAFYTVQDVDECEDSKLQCSHFCHNYIGGYRCSCKPGYFLSEDQHTCAVNCTEERFGEGVLTPPGSPGPYFENAHCFYTLSVEEGMQLVLSFTGDFDVESRDGQCVDSLKIKTDSATFGPFCGQTAPPTITPGARRVQVIFQTDQGGTNHGFSLSYKIKRMECPGRVTADSVILTQKRSAYVTGDKVTVQCVTGYTLDSTADKTFESTCQKSGIWSPVRSCKPVDCGIPEISDPDVMVLTEENPLTTYKQNVSFKCTSMYYRLVGHDSFTCNADGNWEQNGQIVSTEGDLPKCLPVCGINNEVLSAARVFGGENARLGQIPWQLLIKRPKRGGAALISDRWAVTAAHVVEDNDVRSVFHGGMIDGKNRSAIEMVTEKIIIHPGYKRSIPHKDRSDFDNDIALLKMSARVKLSSYLRPVCLPQKTKGPVMEGKIGAVSGFGATEDVLKSAYLKYGYLKEYSEAPCFPTTLKVTDNMFCAGGYDEEKVDSCKGDSGGPLVIPMLGAGPTKTPFQLKGIVSWGPARCGDENLKGYYTKVENYLDWIKETMEKN